MVLADLRLLSGCVLWSFRGGDRDPEHGGGVRGDAGGEARSFWGGEAEVG